LKAVVPLGRDTSRHTTLGLLKAAKLFIKHLEDVDSQQRLLRNQLLQEHRRLEHTVNQFLSSHYRVHSVSESSTVSSVLSTAESVSSIDSEEVDILGFSSCGFVSDADDQSSIDSISSDSGIDITQEVTETMIRRL
jgi:MAX dimerization protein